MRRGARSTQQRQGLPPQPPGGAPAHLAAWFARPLATLDFCTRRYGDAFTLNLGPSGRFTFISDPGLIKEVFTQHRESLWAGAPNAMLAPIVGTRSVLTTDGTRHMRQRKLLLPPFHGDRLAAYRERVAELAAEMVDGWPRGSAVPVADSLQRITLELIVEVVFGVEDEARRTQLLELLPPMTRAATPLLLFPLLDRNLGPRGPAARFHRLAAQVDELVFAEIADHRAQARAGRERHDILTLLVAARDQEGTALDDQELRDELVTLLFAGHETTATALAWAIDLVLQTPPVHRRLVEGLATDDDDYLDAVIKETHRLRPTIPNVVRQAQEDVSLGPWRIPRGEVVSPAIHLVHRRRDLYEDPERFRPERFLDGEPEPYSWLPFGGGIRRCIGAGLAQLEMREILRAAFGRVQLEPASAGHAERPRRRTVTSVPAGGTRVVVRDRAPALSAPCAAAL